MANRYYGQNLEDSFSSYTSCVQPTSSDLVPCMIPETTGTSMSYAGLPTSGYGSYSGASLGKFSGMQSYVPTALPTGSLINQHQVGPFGTCYNRNRYTPYTARPLTQFSASVQYPQQIAPSIYSSSMLQNNFDRQEKLLSYSSALGGPQMPSNMASTSSDQNGQPVTLQINNLDYSMDENSLRHFLLNQLKPITPVLSLIFEGNSFAKVTVPDIYFAKQVVSNLHRKKIGHKRMVVSYSRDSSLTEINTLRCQVAGLLKDVPYCTLPMYKFRELFQSRFKTSISVLDLYKMQDICSITVDKNEEKYISLNPDLVGSIENSPLMECLQHSVPYCTSHFKREQHKGWAEQEIEPLPNVFMTISNIQAIIYPLLKSHTGDIPVASLIHCIKGELGIEIIRNDNGVNLEHLICCVQGIQITTNNFGIKILGWLEPENTIGKDPMDNRFYSKNGSPSDPLCQISREVVELVKMSPKSTMKFNRFIPAYHNHFGKQCRVADYGYTRLIELFEALSSVIQIMGDGENRQITLTHRTQIRRFTSDLLRILRSQGNKSVLLSQLQKIFSQTQYRNFDVTDYGVCDIVDILDGLVNSNTVVVTSVQNGKDILISIPKRKQTVQEIDKTCVFAGEVVELFRNAPQYSILFQKFVRSYHYHFGYQCRLSDYGFLKLADLMEAIQGIVEMEFTTDEDKRIFLSPMVARRVFAEQLEDLIREFTGSSSTCMKLDEVLQLHKKKFGYQIHSENLGVKNTMDAIKALPFVELLETEKTFWIICHFNDPVFRNRSYRACKMIEAKEGEEPITLDDFIEEFRAKYNETLCENSVAAMKHAIEIKIINDKRILKVTGLIKFLIRIIRLLEQRYMTLSEIKSTLNIEMGDCFEFGYPNLYSLLRAYPDIFIVEIGPTQEKSEISLVAQGDLISSKIPHYSKLSQIPKTSEGKRTSAQQRQPLGPCNKQSKTNSFCEEPQNYFKQSNTTLNTKSYLSACNEKENGYNTKINGSLNSSATSDPNSSTGSISGSFSGSKLIERRNINQYGINLPTFNLLGNPSAYPSFGPPKPDSPPDVNVPFWIDPVWANLNDEVSPQIESLNIRLPELKSLNLLPMLMSPYSLSKFENMKQMFSFDTLDRKI